MNDLKVQLAQSMNSKAKAWSDYLGYHARAFFFITLGFLCLAQIGGSNFLSETEPSAVAMLTAVAIASFFYAFVMLVFVIGVTFHFFNTIAPNKRVLSSALSWLGVVYGGLVGLVFWAVARMAASGLSDLLQSGSVQ